MLRIDRPAAGQSGTVRGAMGERFSGAMEKNGQIRLGRAV